MMRRLFLLLAALAFLAGGVLFGLAELNRASVTGDPDHFHVAFFGGGLLGLAGLLLVLAFRRPVVTDRDGSAGWDDHPMRPAIDEG